MTRRAATRAQSTVEFAIIAPLVVMCALGLLGVLAICLDVGRLDDIARTAVRSAITADDPADAADAVARAFRVRADTSVNERTGLVTVIVSFRRPLPIPIIGRIVPPLSLRGSATMMREPPIVLG